MAITYENGKPVVSVYVKDMNGNPCPPPPPGQPPQPTKFVVDTGAGESMATTAALAGGSFKADGTVAAGTAAGKATYVKVSDGSMTFQVEPAAGGSEVAVTCSVPIAVGPANLLGRDQMFIELDLDLQMDKNGGKLKKKT